MSSFNKGIKTDNPSERECHMEARGQVVMFDFCVTRWTNNAGCSALLVTLSFTTETIKAIEHKLHLERYEERKDWDTECRRTVGSILRILVKYFQSVIKI